MRFYCIQMDVAWRDRPANHARAAELITSAAPSPGSIVLLPEMFDTGYNMDAAVTQPVDGATVAFLRRQAALHRVYVIAGVAIAAGEGKARNEAVVAGPGGELAARYAKLHPFSFAGEEKVFTPGEDVVMLELAGLKTAPFVCYDLRFPEAFRLAARRGAQAFAVIANWPTPRHEHWSALLRARAIENQAFVAGVNRVGSDPSNHFAGGSVIFDHMGNALAQAGDGECVIWADVDLDAQREWRQRMPALQDMRDDLLGRG